MAWSYNRNQGKNKTSQGKKKEEVKTAGPIDVSPYTVPNYRRGAPYSDQAVPVYADEPRRFRMGVHQYDTITEQQSEMPFGTYPAAGHPPSEWIGYKQEPYRRSLRFEIVQNAEEGTEFGAEGTPKQRRMRWAMNPYWQPNIVNRPQRPPHEWSFLRPFDRYTLGLRRLNGSHYSQAQTATDNNRVALQGMVPPLRRRSTFRSEPVQHGDNTYSAVASSTSLPGPVMSPVAGLGTRSFRL